MVRNLLMDRMNRNLLMACKNYAQEQGWKWSYQFETFHLTNENGCNGTFIEIDLGNGYLIAVCFLINGKLTITDQFPVKEFVFENYKPDLIY